MNLLNARYVLQCAMTFRFRTGLLLLSGEGDDVADDTVETTPDDPPQLHINGYVWGSLFRRTLARLMNGVSYAEKIGKYNSLDGVSPLWCEASIIPLPLTDIRPGIQIHRAWGSNVTGHLYSQENVPPGLEVPLNFNWFWEGGPKGLEELRKLIEDALWVINQGIENIGGGWSYGFGRLEFVKGFWRELDLNGPEHRAQLYTYEGIDEKGKPLSPSEMVPSEKIALPWIRYILEGKIPSGQLLAIHSPTPFLDQEINNLELPDSFVFRRHFFTEEGYPVAEIIIPGKAVRQTLLSVEIERELRTKGKEVCFALAMPNKGDIAACTCHRCRWFGSTNQRGLVAVLDAGVENPITTVIRRVQLCEHSLQNMHLFSGEYLSQGNFKTEILLDCSDDYSLRSGLKDRIDFLLNQMSPGNSPEGWYRLGATTTSTGQLEVEKYSFEKMGGFHGSK